MLQDSIGLERAQEVTWVFMLRKPPVCEEGKVTFGPLTLEHDPALRQSVTEMPVTVVRLKRTSRAASGVWR